MLDLRFFGLFLLHLATCCPYDWYATTPNVGSVLFTKDTPTECWSRYDIGLLLTRYVMQDLLPKKELRDITSLQEYIELCVSTIYESVERDEVAEIMLHAFADTFGGYVQGYGLPVAAEAFYEGTVQTDTVQQLFMTEYNIKKYLNTDGTYWVYPKEIKGYLSPIRPIKINLIPSQVNCQNLILKPNASDKATGRSGRRPYACPAIPMPFFDDFNGPKAIAVPIRGRSLHSLRAVDSECILSRYYEISINCIYSEADSLRTRKYCLVDFNKQFSKWIKKDLLAHLHDGAWYPAFNGVLRVHRAAEIGACKANWSIVQDEYDSAHFALITATILGLFWLLIVACLFWRYICTFQDDTQDCSAINIGDGKSASGKNANRVFSYNISCWKNVRDVKSNSDWCKCPEPNYVEIEMERDRPSSASSVEKRTETVYKIDNIYKHARNLDDSDDTSTTGTATTIHSTLNSCARKRKADNPAPYKSVLTSYSSKLCKYDNIHR